VSAAHHITDCGLPGIRGIPYGVHMCHFYEGPADLAGALAPYFAAGLRNNERCVAIAAQPLDIAATEEALRGAGLDVAAMKRKGSLLICDSSGLYTAGGAMKDPAAVADFWLHEERQALAAGYSGLRIAGNTAFVDPAHWESFMAYEAHADKVFAGRRIVALCSYHLARCRAAEVLEAVRHHSCTLDRPDDGWQILTGRNRGVLEPAQTHGALSRHLGASPDKPPA
jgi:two-component system, sensor histidine kinase PdtaS